MSAAHAAALLRVHADGRRELCTRDLAVERPIAIEVNGIGHAVMMASPADLVDFGYGFALSERLIADAGDVLGIDLHETSHGTLLRLTLAGAPDAPRVRNRTGDASCGLCGIENLEQAMRPLPVLAPSPPIPDGAIFRALGGMRAHQPLNAATGAVHAGLACDAGGAVLLAREDVGRHNAFDKLIGAMLRDGRSWAGGFALLSSRCSYELVEKAALAGCATLVTVSAPTALAIARAREAGVRLLSLARADSFLMDVVGTAARPMQNDTRLISVE